MRPRELRLYPLSCAHWRICCVSSRLDRLVEEGGEADFCSPWPLRPVLALRASASVDVHNLEHWMAPQGLD